MPGDVKKGEKIFRTRAAQCHSAKPGAHGMGPTLFNIVDRKTASEPGFNYSPAAQAKGKEGTIWTEHNLFKFLENPKKFMPGTKMNFAGIKGEKERNDLIAYLSTLKP